MKHRLNSLAIAGFVLLCIVFGGSSQVWWTNLGLQLAGIALIGWAAVAGSRLEQPRMVQAVNVLVVCMLLLVLLQLIPLPPSLWSQIPGKESVVEGLAILGHPLGPMPISDVPYASVLTLFAAIPAIAALVATERLAPSPRAIAVAIVAGMVASIFVGAAQVAGGPSSSAYFYAIHNPGAVGFFANQNHMGTLFLVAIPMAVALLVSAESKRQASPIARYGFGTALLVLVIIGIALNGSRAAIALSVPVLLASASLFPAALRWRSAVLTVAGVAMVGAVAIVMSNPIMSAELEPGTSNVGLSRGPIWSTSAKAIGDSFPFGTGLGSFEKVYHRYEDPAHVTSSYVNHAHNDYIETALELGAGGAMLIALFLLWWGVAAARIWLSGQSTPFSRAATIATAAILAHSFVDFPLRTGAISAIFGVCIAIMAQHFRPAPATKPGELRPTRHVSLA